MSKSILSAAAVHNERAAYNFVESRIWPDGPVCFHCGATKKHVGKLKGKSTRVGLYKCYSCRKPFTVKMGTMFESSHVPMRLWLQAIYLLYASKPRLRGHRRVRRWPHVSVGPVIHAGSITIRELQQTLGVGLKTASSMSRRIRPGAGRNWGSAGYIVRNRASAISVHAGPKFDNPEQSRRFVEMAREFAADESKDALQRAFAKVLRHIARGRSQ